MYNYAKNNLNSQSIPLDGSGGCRRKKYVFFQKILFRRISIVVSGFLEATLAISIMALRGLRVKLMV